MSVTLRRKKNSDGSTSQYLDIYHNSQRTYEFLADCKLFKPSSPLDRKDNRDRVELAERIRMKREQQIQSDEYDISPAFKIGIDFIKLFDNYLERYTKKDKRIVSACLKQFKDYMVEEGHKKLTTKQINGKVVNQFKEHLEKTLNGETPANYFKKFKRVLKTAMIDKNISASLALEINDISIKSETGIKKDILTYEEIQDLASTQMTNKEVKRAFLFSCFTGLRFCDIINLKWRHVQGKTLNLVQQKTQVAVSINLNKTALNLLGEKQDANKFVFNLPSHTACIKGIKKWCTNAGITKKITWHCARHSFATGIIFYGSDVKNASALLGHKSLAYTDRYLRVVDSLKEKAVENLPELNLL